MKMKKIYLTFSMFTLTQFIHAQSIWTPSGTDISTTTSGNCEIGLKLQVKGGEIEMPTVSPTSIRYIRGVAPLGVLGLYVNTSPTDGANVEVFGDAHGTFNGQVHYNSYHNALGAGSLDEYGHIFQNNTSGTTSAWIPQIGIMKNGKVIISDNLPALAPQDYLTVKRSIGLEAPEGTYRGISGHTTQGSAGIYANYFSTNSAGIEAFGILHNAFPGAIHASSYGDYTGITEKAFSFVNFTPSTNTYHTNISITKEGEMIIAKDRSIADIKNGDILTVKDNIGFLSNTNGSRRAVNGNTKDSWL
ncbi:hypothetical protein HELRODRAFT_184786, partial [Helobdella robusta]|uniref:Uncharacterized protein n=1 Tax=Helobdella robusta TaxID=6412 RepID=T1FLZ8_HELRO